MYKKIVRTFVLGISSALLLSVLPGSFIESNSVNAQQAEKKKKTRRVPAISEQVFKKLGQGQELINLEQEKPDGQRDKTEAKKVLLMRLGELGVITKTSWQTLEICWGTYTIWKRITRTRLSSTK